ncbi:hypothetical protein COLO4_17149 [Corchorus olitorius]|uniref:TIR domain-containing protein n=1 Tax=Corchorus olitorius TaxID=93759 RepID=A0A1R3JDZ4_9ROSI|nr:hypothetical protein COLO4_17149 [Corchorus olitorius]
MASSSSSSIQPRFQVFLSFRGEDTRHSFTSHLLKALKKSGFNVFFDEETLKKGDALTPALLNAITGSKVSIIILSKDYASSKSCLVELSKIMECKHSRGQIVLPIFYRVNPSHVRRPVKDNESPFKESFRQHLKNKPMEARRWKAAFTQVGYLTGWHIHGCNFNRSEPEYIKDIVEDVIKILGHKSTIVHSSVLVGIKDQIEKILLLINQEHTRVIGIWGMGGIGKTTLAEAVYNEVVFGSYNFELDAHCFLQDVRERSLEKYGNGMQSLQNELLFKLLGGNIHVDTRFIGNPLIQDRLRNLRLFVVFDDVSDLDQIKRLGVEHYGPGSKVIVTSRDRHLLRNIGVDEMYKVEKLNEDDSLKLFCKFAFKQDNPVADFLDLSKEFLWYCGGNPLALKVLGASLYQKTRDEWGSALEKLKEYPEEDIFGSLKISFDGLGRLERSIFLDIACFSLRGEGEVTSWLECLYNGAKIGISKLVDKCLLDDHLNMHDLLQEMGRDIVRQESEDPGKRSRLWSREDVYSVLKSNKGTESIKVISLDMSEIKELHISPSIFEKMVNLIFIKFINTNWGSNNKLLLASQDLSYLPDGLRYFQWDYSPLKSLPSNFDPRNLVVLKLHHSNIEQLWNGDQDQEFVNLKEMDLSCSENLRRLPDLLRATKLESLRCGECISLSELPCMTHLISLKALELGRCPISKFPEIPHNLEELNLHGTRIEEVPSFIGSLKKLKYLSVDQTNVQNISSSICELDALQGFTLSHCPNITELDLRMMTPMPSSIPRLQKLQKLWVFGCKSLKSLSGIPPWLERLDASNCTSLERVSFIDIDTSLETVSMLFTDDDFDDDALFNIYDGFAFPNCPTLNQEACDNVTSACVTFNIQSRAKLLAKQLAEHNLDVYDAKDKLRSSLCYLPGSEIADKFESQSRNSSIIVKLEGSGSATSTRFLCFTLCIVLITCHYDRQYYISSEYQLKGRDGVYRNFKREWYIESGFEGIWNSEGEYVFVLFKNSMVHRDMNYTEASFDFKVTCYFNDEHNEKEMNEEIKVEKCGVHVFYVDGETFTVSKVGSSINCSSDEYHRSCTPNIISPNSASPIVHSLPRLTIGEDANVGNDHGLKALLL